ncbi:MAG: hypothetical protein ACRDTG_25880 [Pseudonocardiaceae bacterium]
MNKRVSSGGRRDSVWPRLRQWRFPAEFRIAPAVWPADLSAELDRIEQLRRVASPTAPPAAAVAVEPWNGNERGLAQLATSLWRAQRKVESEDSVGAIRQVGRHVQATWDSMATLGVKVLDHDNEPFDPGLSLDVLAIQPHAGINRETIIQTVKPTIYLRERRIQLGQVIVGTPEEEDS